MHRIGRYQRGAWQEFDSTFRKNCSFAQSPSHAPQLDRQPLSSVMVAIVFILLIHFGFRRLEPAPKGDDRGGRKTAPSARIGRPSCLAAALKTKGQPAYVTYVTGVIPT